MMPASTPGARVERGRSDTTLFMTLLAAFDVLRRAIQRDRATSSSGRRLPSRESHEGTEGIIGYFANTLVLRTQLDDDPTFVELLARVREVALGAFEHQDVPYEKLVLEIQRDRAMGAGSAPLFQTMFTLQDAELRTMQLPGLDVEPFGSARGATKFDLSLFMHEQAGGLRAAFEFRTDLFDATTIDRMLAQLEVLLEGVVADPHARVSTLPLLPAAERQILDAWANGGAQPLEAETLHEQIALQAARTPDAIAVESEDAKLTFRELQARATVLNARCLEGCRTRCRRRCLHRAVGGARRRDARRVEGWWLLPAARSGVSGGSSRVHARGCERSDCADGEQVARCPRDDNFDGLLYHLTRHRVGLRHRRRTENPVE